MSGVGLELDPDWCGSDDLVEDSQFWAVALLIAQRLDLELVLALERRASFDQVFSGTHCNKVVAMHHDGDTELDVVEQAWVGLALDVSTCPQCFSILEGPVECRISSPVHGHLELAALTIVTTLSVLSWQFDIHWPDCLGIEVCT